jgi:hypothetical protein
LLLANEAQDDYGLALNQPIGVLKQHRQSASRVAFMTKFSLATFLILLAGCQPYSLAKALSETRKGAFYFW